MPRTSTLVRHALGLALFASAPACVYPATEIRVVVDTDVDPSIPLVLTVRAYRGPTGGHAIMEHHFVRGFRETVDASFAFPASFSVVPGDTPRDGVTRIEVEADAAGVLLRRIAVVRFTPNATGVLRLFLASRCADPAEGCATSPCTVREACEERGQTCGNTASCVSVETMPSGDIDGSFDDIADIPACGRAGLACCTIGPACTDDRSTCRAGVCNACPEGSEACCDNGVARANGTECAASPDACHAPGTCTDGVCSPIAELPDGTECAPANGACVLASTCATGVCTAHNAPNGTMCRAAANACQLDAACSNGACPANPTRADNFVVSSTQRCCGGAVTSITSASNCGVCGLRCRSGTCSARAVNGTHYFCTCSGTADCSPLSTCRNQTPNANVCACTSDSQCPGSSTCVDVNFNPNYCN